MGRPKGSKNKPKHKAKPVKEPRIPQKHATIMPELTQDETCRICERVPFGKLVYLGFGHWRHDICGLGSKDWELYFQRQSKATKAVLQPFRQYYKEREL